ncbi:LysE family transporter [Pygmaiobacter massiliensis]|uniref:LysE family translocator n=1 Tax=Pygmaiobacter massiliensis TaxID=1917873 RepID=UPI002A801C91|nr:LysE family transporter [Pygmaiobacter massiliensis]MDY4785709.1 LysE family transporter [Pygmaiobacter massiliensis]
MLFRGLRFGMLLQLAIGPVCLFVFGTAVDQGFTAAFAAVLGTALTDGSEIALAILGMRAVFDRLCQKEQFFRWFGTLILAFFGISSILGSFDINLLPSFTSGGVLQANAFVKAVLLALSNPLTVVFWAGIFASKIQTEGMKGRDLWWFGGGCVLATLTFLTGVAWLGAFAGAKVPALVVKGLNLVVGAALLLFAIRTFTKKSEQDIALK